jgi:hypothetical protein
MIDRGEVADTGRNALGLSHKDSHFLSSRHLVPALDEGLFVK